MTKDAQFALRRGVSLHRVYISKISLVSHASSCVCFFGVVIEKYTRSTRFALICNHVNKIIPALQSRCTRFRFAPLAATHVTERLQHVINAEGYAPSLV